MNKITSDQGICSGLRGRDVFTGRVGTNAL